MPGVAFSGQFNAAMGLNAVLLPGEDQPGLTWRDNCFGEKVADDRSLEYAGLETSLLP